MPATAEAFDDREFAFSRRNFAQIARLVHDQSGIHLTESKAMLVYSRLAKRLRNIGCPDFDTYCKLVESQAGSDERNAMLAALTTNVTRFFRESHHFKHLSTRILPSLAAAARRGERIRIWSAACSSGEEPYSIALALLEACPEAPDLDIRILATDIDPNVLETGRRAQYSGDKVAPIDKALRSRWLQACGDDLWCLRPEVRGLVAFKQLNLNGDWPMQGPFDVIFCRNCVIYFDEPTQDALWRRFRDILTSDGVLYVGHSERVDVPGFVSNGLTSYARQGARRS